MKTNRLTGSSATMSRSVRAMTAIAVGVSVMLGANAAWAQAAAGCDEIQKFLGQRKAIGGRISAASSGKKIDAKVACGNFGQLVTNGNSLLAWVKTNKDWCQIPDNFVQSLQADHGRAVSIRGKACGVAAKQAQMEKQARQAGDGGQGGGLLGGPGLTGQSRLPQGAL